MPFTTFTLAMLLICILCLGREIFHGFVRGPLRALVSLCAVVLGIVCSIFVSHVAGALIADAIMTGFVNDLIVNNVEIVAGFDSVYQTASFLIQAIVNVLIFSFAFPICKRLVAAIASLVIKQNLKKLDKGSVPNTKTDKLLGSIIGVVCGVLVSVTVISPIMGTLHLLDDVAVVVDDLNNDVLENEELAALDLSSIKKYSTDALGGFCYDMGGKLIYKYVTVADFAGERVCAADEISYIRGTAGAAIDIAKGFLEEEEEAEETEEVEETDAFDLQATSESLLENFEKSVVLKTVATEIITEFSSAWLRGDEFFGIPIPDFNDDLLPMVHELLVICANTNEETITTNAKTLLVIVDIVIECDITSTSTARDVDYALLATKLYAAFEENPEMEEVKWKLEKVALVAISNAVSKSLTSSQRSAIATLIATDATSLLLEADDPQTYSDAINLKLMQRFEEFHLQVEPALCDLFTNKLLEIAKANEGRITAMDVNQLLTQTPGGLIN